MNIMFKEVYQIFKKKKVLRILTTNCTAPSLWAGKHSMCLSAEGSGDTSHSPNRLSRVSQVKSRWGECGKENTWICR